jgi:hypothetical protein
VWFPQTLAALDKRESATLPPWRFPFSAIGHLLALGPNIRSSRTGGFHRRNAMGLIVLLVILLLLFGGGGFYYGPPYHYYGGGLGLVLLIIIVVLLLRGRA